MKVFKFGGASVKDADAIRNVTHILATYKEDKILIVVSAMGKTTNALERVCQEFIHGNNIDELISEILDQHLEFCFDLFDDSSEIENQLIALFSTLTESLSINKNKSTDFIYDLIVSRGEMMSSLILRAFLFQEGQKTYWLDAATIVKTDDKHRAAVVDWGVTTKKIQEIIPNLLQNYNRIVTQGFIGSSIDDDTVTLGREGSDYTGAIIAYCSDIPEYFVWKDVPGIMSADPRLFPDATLLPQLSYREAIEMTYFGAKVIHPKTIQPLQRKKIKLYVRSFTEPDQDGTLISETGMESYPPIIIYENNQCLLNITTRDFSFVQEEQIAEILSLISRNSIKVNMMQNSAVSFSLCCSDRGGRMDYINSTLKEKYHVQVFTGMDLVTIRYYNDIIIDQVKSDHVIHLEELSKFTQRMVLSKNPKE